MYDARDISKNEVAMAPERQPQAHGLTIFPHFADCETSTGAIVGAKGV